MAAGDFESPDIPIGICTKNADRKTKLVECSTSELSKLAALKADRQDRAWWVNAFCG